MRSFAAALVLILGTIVVADPARHAGTELVPRFMAFCTDGDGSVSDWLPSRYEAYLEGREHERSFRGHRWEIWTQDGETQRREPVCSRIVPGEKPDSLMVVNVCGKCLRFTVARTNQDGSVNAKEFTIRPGKGRHFRVIPNSKLTVDAERDCPL